MIRSGIWGIVANLPSPNNPVALRNRRCTGSFSELFGADRQATSAKTTNQIRRRVSALEHAGSAWSELV